MLHTIQEAMKLTGVSRRTLYNHSDGGRVSYSVGHDGRRYFETAELERVYGKLTTVAHSDAQQLAQSFTPPPATGELAKLIEDAVHRATAPLVAEIAELRETLMRIEHKPDAPAPATPAPGQPSDAPATVIEPDDPWADIFASLHSKQ
jgi:DNA-binding transcriptional MerR regulator